MYTPFPTQKYKKSYKKIKRSGKFKERELNFVINTLALGQKLGNEYRDHALRGDYNGFRECHIRGDLLLVYKIEGEILLLILADIGSHSSIFDM
ncbi:MAG: hypothetical protein RL641_303 [Candidatus Parcubacteria bacterium]|jgi:mRNA interferase YafQ